MGYNILLGIGLIFLVLSLYQLRNTFLFISSGEKTIGNVAYIDQSEKKDEDGNYAYTPVFKFRTKSNEEVSVRHVTSYSKEDAWQQGQEVEILYNPARPSQARLYSYFPLFTWGVLLLAFAMPFLVIGGGYWLFKWFLRF